jgi:hypothetical protein
MPDSHTPAEEPMEETLGTVHEKLAGWVPELATAEEIRAALEKAFDYRGDLTLTLKDGQKIEGYVFDRKLKGSSLDDCIVRVMPKGSADRVSIRYSEIAALAFSGRDTAEGKSFAAWVKKYNQRKAAGEKNIGIDPEPLE